MDIATFDQLISPAGQEIILTALGLDPTEANFLAHFQTLSRLYPTELARAGLEIAILRAAAVGKFPQAEKMYFTQDALQQATSHPVSVHRAERYNIFDTVLDLGCSIGGDTLALAERVPTIGFDQDFLRLRMAQENMRNLGLAADFIQSDLQTTIPIAAPFKPSPTTAIFFDPARRANHQRRWSVEQYLPPLSSIVEWLPSYPALGVKISPGVRLDELSDYQAEIEFISFKRELKEAALWFGPLKSADRRATVLPGPHTLIPVQQEDLPAVLSEPLSYLYEPDPAILRAGLVRDLAARLEASQLDPTIAYLTAGQKVSTPFARVWQIEDWFPFQLKRLRAYLRERRIGRVVVKKRGSPLQPEALIRDLRLKGDGERVVTLTQLRGRPVVIIALP